MPFLKSLRFDGLLSFPPGSEAIELTPLNVLIGPNGSGKSNLIEGIELLHALPTGLASAIREGGGVREWLWKGGGALSTGGLHTQVDLGRGLLEGASYDPLDPLDALSLTLPEGSESLQYGLTFAGIDRGVEVIEEILEGPARTENNDAEDSTFYYCFRNGRADVSAVDARGVGDGIKLLTFRDRRSLDRRTLRIDESVLSQLKDPIVYPELTQLGRKLEAVRSFREWTFGPKAEVRKGQPTDWPTDVLLPDARNLGSLLNRLEHSAAWSEFNSYLTRFLPRFQRYSTRIEGGTVQFYLHEDGLKLPVPATRLSDGTIRFIAILAQLLSPTPPPLICMEEPELGLHPDAVSLLADLLQEASQRTQLLVTTHSDALVSALTDHADSVLVCEYRNGTVCRRVDSAKLRFWLDKYRLGEIWRIGEIGGNP